VVGLFNNGTPTPAFDLASQLHVVKGDGPRLTGEHRGTEIFQPVGYNLPEQLKANKSFGIASGGDIDGDGSTDLVISAGAETLADTVTYLLPGARNNPE
jgi:hypothetical protein